MTLSDILSFFTDFVTTLFGSGSSRQWVKRLVDFIVGDPLILAVIAMFFAGFVVSIFVRIYKSS